jgi:hypothetical protein
MLQFHEELVVEVLVQQVRVLVQLLVRVVKQQVQVAQLFVVL